MTDQEKEKEALELALHQRHQMYLAQLERADNAEAKLIRVAESKAAMVTVKLLSNDEVIGAIEQAYQYGVPSVSEVRAKIAALPDRGKELRETVNVALDQRDDEDGRLILAKKLLTYAYTKPLVPDVKLLTVGDHNEFQSFRSETGNLLSDPISPSNPSGRSNHD